MRAHGGSDPSSAPRRRAIVMAALGVVLAGTLAVAFITSGSDADDDRIEAGRDPASTASSARADTAATPGVVPSSALPTSDAGPRGRDGGTTTVDREATTPTAAARRPITTERSSDISVLRDDGTASADRQLVEAFTVSDAELTPKSVVASGDGLFFAQNMMYRHNVSVYDRAGDKVATIPDRVDLSQFGVAGGVVADGSPVEAAFTPDGRYAYVSNYKMYGPGFNPVADDPCDAGDWDDSFVYRIDTRSMKIDEVIPTGAVPKFLAVTPDATKLLVSNWCGFDVSVIDVAKNAEITRIPVGRHPRGIAVTKDSSVAYVTVMGEARIVRLDLASLTTTDIPGAGGSPRHLVLSPDDRYLYVSNNLEGVVRKIDLQAGVEAGRVASGIQPRSMVITPDGTALFVVNYQDGTVSKVRTADMTETQELYSGVHPVGITYDHETRQVWVANYAGSLKVYVDR